MSTASTATRAAAAPSPEAPSAAGPAVLPARSSTSWAIDPAHTDVLFSARHMMVTTVRGKFNEVTGQVTLDETDPTRSSADIRIATASLGTGNEARDAHLRSADFFDAEAHPEIAFRSTSIEHVGGDDYRITGDLTIRGTTRPITFEATFLGFYASMKGTRRAGISARTTLRRADWGLNWNVALEKGGWLVSEEVKLDVEIAVDEAVEARQAA